MEHAFLAWENTKILMERFTNGHSLDPLMKSLFSLMGGMASSNQSSSYMTKFRAFFLRAWRSEDASYFTDREALRSELRGLIQEGRYLFLKKHRTDTKRILAEIAILRSSIKEDQNILKLVDSLKILKQDMFMDDHGKFMIKPELLLDLERVLPILLDKVTYFPLPHQFISTDDFDLSLDNLIVHMPHLADNHLKLSISTEYEGSELTTLIHAEVKNLYAEARGFDFIYVSKKRGLRGAREAGKGDFFIGGDGMSLKITFRPVLSRPVQQEP